MSEQLGLFAGASTELAHFRPRNALKSYENRRSSLVLSDTPRARESDPVTSHEAAEAIKASGDLGRQQRAVLDAVRRWPGLTSLELGARMDINRWAVARRLPELEPVHVRKGEPRLVNGRRAVTWWPVERS